MADSTLAAIQTKVRRLTRSPSEAQLTNDQLNEYVNTFVLYDFPEHLRLFDFRTTFTFVTSPYIDVYQTNTIDPSDQFFNFKNKYITVHPPVYAAGFQMWYSQSRNEFFGNYPFLNSIQMIAAGDGATLSYTGTLNANPLNLTPPTPNTLIPVLQNNVLFDSLDSNNEGLSLIDVPVVDASTGNPTNDGNLYSPNDKPATPPTVIDPANTINYVTGVYTITFPFPPGVGKPVNSQSVPYQPTLPQAILFYDNKFTLRPVPDQPYRINMEVYIRPTELLAADQSPDLEQFWQYIAYGAAKKILEDRLDPQSVETIMPEFKQQELLVIRKTIVQQTNERVATIYTPMTDNYGGWGSGSGGWGGPF